MAGLDQVRDRKTKHVLNAAQTSQRKRQRISPYRAHFDREIEEERSEIRDSGARPTTDGIPFPARKPKVHSCRISSPMEVSGEGWIALYMWRRIGFDT